MNKKFTKLMAALALLTFLAVPMGMWGQQTTWSHEFVSPEAVSNNSITVEGVTWSIATTVGAGSPIIDKGNSYGKYCLKFGTGKNTYFSNITFSTDYFNSYNVQSVTIQVLHNASKSGTFTATQGDVTIGTSTNTIGTAWTNVTVNTNPGNGGTLSFSYSPDACAVNLHAITVTYTDGTQPTTYTVTYNGNSNTSGTVPTDNNAYGNGDNVTVLGNTGNLAKTGHTFSGWCLNAEGTGTVYGPNNTTTYSISSNTTFYAKWTLNTHNITMPTADAYGSYNASETSNVPYGNIVTLTYTPATGYENYVATWSVNGDAISGDTFSMPDEDVTITVNVAEMVDYATLPFEYDGNALETPLPNGLTQQGLTKAYSNSPKIQFNDTDDWLILHFNERPGKLTFDIKGNSFSGSTFKVQTSEDGTTFTDLATYTNLTTTLQSEKFNNLGENVRYIKWIYTQKVSGNVALGNIALDEYVAPQEYTLTVEPFENLELITFVNDEMVMEGDGEIQVTNGNQIMLSIVANEGYVMETLMVNGVNHVNDIADDYTYTFEMPTENVTISATAVEDVPATPGTWVLTDLADLTENDVFVIVGDNGNTYAMSNDNGTSAAPAAVAVTVVEGTLSAEPAANLQWNISITDDGYTFYPNGETETWLYCTNTNNGVRVGTNTNNVFVLVNESGYLMNVATSRYIGIYDSQDWRCYTNTTGNIAGQTFSFYKKVGDEPATETHTLTINGYGSSTTGGWNLIASPVTELTPSDDNGFLTDSYGSNIPDGETGTYDLYYFDQTGGDNGKEWKNYRRHNFNLESGKGYLYASKEGTDLIFTGTAYNGNGVVNLTYSESTSIDDNMRGWNLIGNPFGTTANLPSGLSYYTLNESRTELTPGSATTIGAMKAIFVQATTTGQSVTFTKQTRNDGSNAILSLNLSSVSNGLIDRAIVRFDEGNALPKFMLNPNNTKVFIPVESKDYAVVRHEAQGEMPVNFKAAENGTYTLTVNPEGVEMNYLHLIDNMTGADVDLLATPSYTFNATTRDYESRFRLVFAANNEDGVSTGSTAFAFFSNGTWVISNDGEATLQVIDVTGRVLSSETVNGSVSKAINAPAGVYMLRLINGNDVKTQKIVVR